MWQDLTLVSNFLLSMLQSIFNLIMQGGILITSIGLWILAHVVKFFRRIL